MEGERYDDGFHDHALSELFRAVDDLAPYYSAEQLSKLIAEHVAARSVLVEERA